MYPYETNYMTLEYEQFVQQLTRLAESRELYKNLPLLQHDLVHSPCCLHLTVPNSTRNTGGHIELLITFSRVYREPLLLIRVWATTALDGIETSQLAHSAETMATLRIPSYLTLGLDTILDAQYPHALQGAWYSVHPCDTRDIVGDDVTVRDTYLDRWVSVFLLWVCR